MEKKILKFVKGDETRPKIENFKGAEWDNAIFSDIYFRAFDLMKDIISMQVNETSDLSSYQRERNNIIAFIGERGSGKTSCMQTIYQAITRKKYPERYSLCFAENSFLSLPVIDPSYFDDNSSIIEIIIAKMFQNFKNDAANPYNHLLIDENRLLEKKRILVKCFQDVKDSLDCINDFHSSPISNDSIEELSSMASGSNLRLNMENLIDRYLDYFNRESDKKAFLVIAIDDLDVQTKHTYKMVEQIRKYLIVNRVIILTGVKLVQLSDLIKQSYYLDYKVLIDKGVISDTIEDMTGRYLAKLIPLSHRLFIPEVKTDLNILLQIADEAANLNVSQTLLRLIYTRTQLSFYNTLEQVNLIVPSNLRELLNLIALLYNMQDVSNLKGKCKKQIIVKNRRLFKDYFVESWCLDNLNAALYDFIQNLVACEVWQANKFTIDFLYTHYMVKKDDSSSDNLITISNNRRYNISIGDVNYILDRILSSSNDIFTQRLIFAIKTIYSMALYDYFHIMKEESYIREKSIDLISRIKGVNAGDKQWKAQNKLNHISDYEKLLGGSLIHVSRYYRDNSRVLIGLIDNKILRDYYASIEEEFLDESKKNEMLNNKDIVFKFELIEFFILTHTFMSDATYVRTFRHCYYDSFPLSSLEPSNVVSNQTAILFNIVKYYNLYQKYKYIGSKQELAKYLPKPVDRNPFVNFFEMVSFFKEKSLLYNILHCDFETKKEYVVDEPVFRNKSLEYTFIINMEILDILEDYLDNNISKKRKYMTSNDVDLLTKFYTDLKNFQYYLYSKKSLNIDEETASEEDEISEPEYVEFKHFGVIVDFLDGLKKSNEKIAMFNSIYNPQLSPSNKDGEFTKSN